MSGGALRQAGPGGRRILHLFSGREKGGITRVVGAISSLRSLDAEVIIGILGQTAGELPPGRRVVRFGRKGSFDVQAAARLVTFVRSEKIAIVHTHNVTSNIYGLLLKLAVERLVHVVHVHGQFARILSDSRASRLKKLLLLRGNAWALRRCDRIIAVSTVVRDFVAGLTSNADRIDVIPNGVDVPGLELEAGRACAAAEAVAARRRDSSSRPVANPPGRASLVGALGRLAPVKNYPMLLQAARLVLRDEPATFAIVGDGPERASLERTAAELGIAKDVVFTGWVANPYPLLAEMDVVASTSFTEGFPVGLLEAAALARPVVATDVGGVREIVREGETGFVVPSGDAEALARAVVRLLRDPALRRELGDRGRQVASAEFSADGMRERVEQLYASALEEQRRRGAA